MSKSRKPSLEERLAQHSRAADIHRGLGSALDKLPVSELTKTVLKHKSGEVVVAAAETGTAIASGATVAGKGVAEAAREGVRRYEDAKEHMYDQPVAPAPTVPAAGPADLVTKLERLETLHRRGGIDDQEYRDAKARLLASE
jgi:hypothetical protein